MSLGRRQGWRAGWTPSLEVGAEAAARRTWSRTLPQQRCARIASLVAWIWGTGSTTAHRWPVLRSRIVRIPASQRLQWYASVPEQDAASKRRGRRSPASDLSRKAPASSAFDRSWDAARLPRQRPMHQQQRARTAEEPLTPLQEKLRSGHDFLYGLAPVLAALTAVRRTTFYELFVLDRLELGDDLNRSVARKASKKAMEEEIVERARQLGVPVRHMDKGMLNTLSGNRPHQGFVLECTTLEMIPMVPAEQFQPATAKRGRRDSDAAVDKSLRPCWLALDEVWDPQNLGALLRSAYFLGCDGVMLTRKNSAGLTATVSKASSGAMEFMDIHAVSNMPQFLETAHRVHGWSVLGAALPNRPMLPDTEGPQGASRPCQQEFGRRSGARPVVPCAELSLQLPTILVLGNEGHGLRTNVERACTAFTYIEHGLFMDSSPSLTVVDSLNVSVAGAILMHRLLHGPA